MPILDLITPWAQAEQAGAHSAFGERWHELLEPLRRQRAPTEVELPAPADWDGLAERAADGALHQLLRDVRDRLVDRGLRAPAQIVLIASAAPGGLHEVIPKPDGGTIALFVDRIGTRRASTAAVLAHAMALLTRWTHPTSPMAAIAAHDTWDRWEAARRVPLAEWIYAAGLGGHAAAMVASSSADALLLAEGEVTRLRQGERALQARLDGDIGHAGVGLVMRWLEDEAPVPMRRAPDGTIIPRGAGRYLGWRMLAGRVERVGLAEAVGL